jgi:hypothetical protein
MNTGFAPLPANYPASRRRVTGFYPVNPPRPFRGGVAG